ncbi:MAG: ATP synthase F1 subunit delta [Marinilabiliaceae bacterium]|jgi:F-type H+-transporting ATPase subunit delta|nr:ATP synthase F1 subunit delta [Marinilabiliaceae bacterium]
MNIGLIARRYATVLYEYADKKGDLEQTYQCVSDIRAAFEQAPSSLSFLASPLRKQSEKLNLVNGVFAKNVAQSLADFLVFLVEKERIDMVDDILRVFQSLYRKRKGIKSAVITTAIELSAEKQAKFTNELSVKLNAPVEALYNTDSDIIGGVIFTIDGKQLDNSVKHQLEEIEKQLKV